MVNFLTLPRLQLSVCCIALGSTLLLLRLGMIGVVLFTVVPLAFLLGRLAFLLGRHQAFRVRFFFFFLAKTALAFLAAAFPFFV